MGCMSEDMDMFVYGCTRVLRGFDLTERTLILYEMDLILKELKMDQLQFRENIFTTGTDYNNSKCNIFTIRIFL